MEYASTVWDPYTKSCIQKIEMIQRTAARYVTNNWHYKASVSDILSKLQWPTLEERRRQQRLIMLYKMHNNLVMVNRDNKYISPISKCVRGATSAAYLEPYSQSDYQKYSFFP